MDVLAIRNKRDYTGTATDRCIVTKIKTSSVFSNDSAVEVAFGRIQTTNNIISKINKSQPPSPF